MISGMYYVVNRPQIFFNIVLYFKPSSWRLEVGVPTSNLQLQGSKHKLGVGTILTEFMGLPGCCNLQSFWCSREKKVYLLH